MDGDITAGTKPLVLEGCDNAGKLSHDSANLDWKSNSGNAEPLLTNHNVQ
jgi:hypothetical protein